MFKKEETENHTIFKIFKLKIKIRKVSNNKILVVNPLGQKRQVHFIKGLKVKFIGENSAVILHEPIIKFRDSKILLRSNCTVEIGTSKHYAINLHINSQADNQTVKIGANFLCTNNCQILFSKEENLSVSIGNNCMFGPNINIRPSDGHTITDKFTDEILNTGKNIELQDNVWLGLNTIILKGATIAKNCVIGAGSIVTKACKDENSIYAGSPARKIKSNICWYRETIPDYIKKTKN